MDLEHFDAPEGSVILIKGSSLDQESEELMLGALMERFPGSLIVILGEGMSFEDMELAELEQMLEHLIEHKKATASGSSSD